jgi:hypothetical protein
MLKRLLGLRRGFDKTKYQQRRSQALVAGSRSCACAGLNRRI